MIARPMKYNSLFPLMIVMMIAGCNAVTPGTSVTVTDIGNVEGVVTDSTSGSPISGVAVQIGDKANTTDVNGVFTLQDLAVGSRTVTANKAGYSAYANTVTVSKGTTVSHNIQMNVATGLTGTLPPLSSNPTVTLPPLGSNPTVTQPPAVTISIYPAHLQADVVSSNHIHLSWTFTQPAGGNASSGIAIARKDGANGIYKIVGSVASNIYAYEDSGLTPSTTYYYKFYYYTLSQPGSSIMVPGLTVYAETKSGYSNEVSATTLLYSSNPSSPSGLTASASSGWAVNLSWTDTSDNEDGFAIERSLNGTDFAQTDTVTSNVTSYQDRNVSGGRQYWYRVKAFNSVGASSSASTASITTPAISPTLVSGSIFNATTWTLANSPYQVTGQVTVFPDVVLTIEPGVEIRFADATVLEVRGSVNAVGTASQPIIFTSVAPDTATRTSWNGIHIANNLGGRATLRYVQMSYSNGLSVDCCGQGGPVEIYDSLFSNNSTASVGYAGWVTPYVRAAFVGNGTAMTSADKRVYYSYFKNNDYGLNSTERISVYYSVFNGHTAAALFGGRGELKYCTISGNNVGVQGFFEGFTPLTYNIITGNHVGIITGSYDAYSPSIHYNNIYDNSQYNVQNNNSSNKDLTNNWWGTTFPALIDPAIYDAFDNASLGIVTYTPLQATPFDIIP